MTQPSLTVDARPVLRRSEDSLWERTEQLRREIATAVEAECSRKSIEALVLQSDAYVHPAWVRFECWMPRGGDGLTARSAMTVTITAIPCHRFETVYSVQWEQHGRRNAIHHLHTFGEAQVAWMISNLCNPPAGAISSLLPNDTKRLLKRVQLRQASWHVWKPRNKMSGLRRDRLQVAGLIALALGAVLMVSGMGAASSTLASAEPIGAPSPAAVMVRTIALEPQGRGTEERTTGAAVLEKDRTMTGTLDDRDPRRDGKERYDAWSYLATAGESFAIAMESSSFDTALEVGVVENGAFRTIGENDDYGARTDSRVEVTVAEGREYLILASSVDADAAGGYSLRVGPLAAAPRQTESEPPLVPASPESSNLGATFMAGLLLATSGLVGLIVAARAPRVVRSAGKPLAEPRILYSLDSWQTVVFGAGEDTEEIRARLIARFGGSGQNRFTYASERVWYWGLDGKSEREQLVLRYGRALAFCQIHQYGSDLYVGWNAQMNLGTWRERKLASGVDARTGERVHLMTVEHAVQPTNDYDLTDLNSLAELTHAQITAVLKTYLKEKQIDQEIDFAIIRGQREGLTKRDDKDSRKRQFQRKA